MIRYTKASDDTHLEAIIQLQSQNLPTNISQQEADNQGFVTLQHDVDLLRRMNQPFPHIVALDDDQVVGYALVMLRLLEKEIPLLVPMFEHINPLVYAEKPLGEQSYFIMGQVCIAKSHRSQGLFEGLYQKLKEQMSPHFDYIVTEISSRNLRSQRAHFRIGFELIKEYQAPNGASWMIVLLALK